MAALSTRFPLAAQKWRQEPVLGGILRDPPGGPSRVLKTCQKFAQSNHPSKWPMRIQRMPKAYSEFSLAPREPKFPARASVLPERGYGLLFPVSHVASIS